MFAHIHALAFQMLITAGGTNKINELVNGLQDGLQKLVVPIAVIGFILAGIAFLLTPILPDWAQTMKGYFIKACLVVAFLGASSAIVEGLFALGGA